VSQACRIVQPRCNAYSPASALNLDGGCVQSAIIDLLHEAAERTRPKPKK